MAKEKTETPPEEPINPNKGASISQLIVPLLNSVALMATLGFIFYSKLLFKKAIITESTERERLLALHLKQNPTPVSTYISFDPITVNIKANPDQPLPMDGTSQQINGKLHFITLSFALEIRDAAQQDFIKAVTPLILDRLILILGRKYYSELTTVQGRYILHSQFLDQINPVIAPLLPQPTKEAVITNIYFTQFIVQ